MFFVHKCFGFLLSIKKEFFNMPKNLASGSGTNVTNLKTLITAILGYGDRYNPINALITLEALQALYLLGLSAVNSVDAVQPANTNAKNARTEAFDLLDKLTTRIGNAFKSIVANDPAREHVRSMILVIQRGRVNLKKEQPPVNDPTAEPTTGKENASHKSGYDKQLENFYKLIQYLASFPAYMPNEADLTVAGLSAFYNELTVKNQLVNDTQTVLNKARIIRTNVIDHPETGLVFLAKASKSYVSSVYGAKSPEYKQLTKLGFRTYKS